jgi:hypothetical protein
MEFQADVIGRFEDALCQIIKQCEKKVNDEQFGEGGQPDKDYCTAKATGPGAKSDDTGATYLGRLKDKCAEGKVNQRKKDSTTPLSKSVRTQTRVPVKGGGGHCFPDVTVGTPPNCNEVYDFKTSCPRDPERKKGSWGTYKSKSGTTDYEGASQFDVYKDSCFPEDSAKEPKIIHPDADICNRP